MDSSRLRQKLLAMDKQRLDFLRQALRPSAMISGSLFQMHRRCGNPRCKCSRGKLHASWYLSRPKEGKTKLTYIGRIVPNWLSQRVGRYQQYQKRLAAIRKIDTEISRGLNRLRDEKVQSFEQAERERL